MPFLTNQQRFLIVLFITLIITIPIVAYNLQNIRNFLQKNGATPEAPVNPQTTYHCPTIVLFCQTGHDIIKDDNYLGFGGEVAAGSPVLAAFNGELTSSTTILPNEEIVSYYLDSDADKTRAIYYFKGPSSASRLVRRGEEIGMISGKMTTFNAALIFQIIVGDPMKGEVKKVTAADFTK